jgi:hypothetical protein
MQFGKKAFLAWCLTGLLVACGGGSDGGDVSPPPTSGTPTAAFTASEQTASDLAADAVAGAQSMFKTGLAQGAPLGGLLGAPTGVSDSYTGDCSVSGSIHYSYNLANPNPNGNPVAGDTYTLTLNNCEETAGEVENGTIKITFTRFVSEADTAFTVQLTNYSITTNGVTEGPYTLSASFDVSNGVYSYAFNVDGATVVGMPVMHTSGTQVTIESGVIRKNYGSGWVEWSYDYFVYDSATQRPISGTVTVTGSGGNSAVLRATANGYIVDITVNGATTTYNVAY